METDLWWSRSCFVRPVGPRSGQHRANGEDFTLHEVRSMADRSLQYNVKKKKTRVTFIWSFISFYCSSPDWFYLLFSPASTDPFTHLMLLLIKYFKIKKKNQSISSVRTISLLKQNYDSWIVSSIKTVGFGLSWTHQLFRLAPQLSRSAFAVEHGSFDLMCR